MSNLSQSSSTASTLDWSGRVQLAAELQIVGRVGEDEVDAAGRQAVERGDAIALDDGVERQAWSAAAEQWQ